MSSILYRIEIYDSGCFGCPDYNLMGYGNIIDLLEDCNKKYALAVTDEQEKKE